MYLPTDLQEYQIHLEGFTSNLESVGLSESPEYLSSANNMLTSLAKSWTTRTYNFIQTVRQVVAGAGQNQSIEWPISCMEAVLKYRPDIDFTKGGLVNYQSTINLNDWLASLPEPEVLNIYEPEL